MENMELVDSISPKARKTLYLVFAALTIAVGAFQVGFSSADLGQPVWLDVATAVVAFLGGAFGVTAYSNTNKGGAAVVRASQVASPAQSASSQEPTGSAEAFRAEEAEPVVAQETFVPDSSSSYLDPVTYVGQDAPRVPVTSAEVDTAQAPSTVDTTGSAPVVQGNVVQSTTYRGSHVDTARGVTPV